MISVVDLTQIFILKAISKSSAANNVRPRTLQWTEVHGKKVDARRQTYCKTELQLAAVLFICAALLSSSGEHRRNSAYLSSSPTITACVADRETGKLSEGATYKKWTIFYLAIKPKDNTKTAQCQQNWCCWQVYGLKIYWQLETLAKKKANTYNFQNYATTVYTFSVFQGFGISSQWVSKEDLPWKGTLGGFFSV